MASCVRNVRSSSTLWDLLHDGLEPSRRLSAHLLSGSMYLWIWLRRVSVIFSGDRVFSLGSFVLRVAGSSRGAHLVNHLREDTLSLSRVLFLL